MDIQFNGINLQGTDLQQLHKIAGKMGISKSWFRMGAMPCYDVICPFKAARITAFLNKNRKGNVKQRD